MGGSYSKAELSPLTGKVSALHTIYCKKDETSLKVQYDWSLDSYRIFDSNSNHFYTDYRVSMSRKLLLLDSSWNAVCNIKKKSKWTIYRGGSSDELIGQIISLNPFTAKMIAHIKLLNGDILEMVIEGKGMAGGIWIGNPKLGGIPVANFDLYNDNDCNIQISRGMDIAIIILLFLIYRKTVRR